MPLKWVMFYGIVCNGAWLIYHLRARRRWQRELEALMDRHEMVRWLYELNNQDL